MPRIYAIYLKLSMLFCLQHRAAMVIWMTGRIIEPTMYLVVWTVVVASRGVVAGYAADDFAAYYIVLMVVNQLTFSWVWEEMEQRIRTGSFSFLLLKPVHPIHRDIADNIGYKVLALIVILPAALILTVLFQPPFAFTAGSVLLFVPALLLAFLLRFFLDWTVALVTFWTTRASALQAAYMTLTLFLSGRIAPLELLPGIAGRVAEVAPFRWTVAFPVDVLLGRVGDTDVWNGLALQALWVAGCFILMHVLWRLALRQYAAVGS